MVVITSNICFAQIIVTPFPTVQTITPLLQGRNTIISNVVINCSNQAIALIDATNSNLGIGNALALSTGSIYDMATPNNSPSTSSNWGLPGDTDLAAITSNTFNNSYDACIVEFDAVPAYNNINFKFVFASEDYPENLNPAYQDNCGVFISGNGITGKKNLALVPGTSTPVNAASVNATTNASLFIDNTGGSTFQYDGFTTIIKGSVATVPQSTYHFKIGIVDLGDVAYDSGLLIDSSGFWSAQSSGISELSNNGVSIFPNPVIESADIVLSAIGGNENTFHLFNVNGQMVQNQTIYDTHFMFHRNNLPSGIYFLEITGDGNTYRSKLILN